MNCVSLHEAAQDIHNAAVQIDVFAGALFRILWDNGVVNWWAFSAEYGDLCRTVGSVTT